MVFRLLCEGRDKTSIENKSMRNSLFGFGKRILSGGRNSQETIHNRTKCVMSFSNTIDLTPDYPIITVCLVPSL